MKSVINILDKNIYTKIAAGEVVERPASIIKECVENSIDAGAKRITIEILGGGITKIRISDDGCGIYKDDLSKAFLPHATSKIKNIDDLSKIGTLGFRGEALSSIASVAKVSLVSKTKDSETGAEINISGGEILSINDKGCPDGTSITINDIFYCVPARAKFLKKPKTEEGECTNIVSRLILANPSVSFKYVVDERIVYQSTGTSMLDAIFTIYGKETVDNMIELSYNNPDNGIRINGYISKPTYIKPNRTYQTLSINNRYVINYSISSAIQKAYEPFMMKNGFAQYIINMDLPLDKIDVNVHPNKLEVKFEDTNKIFGLFYNLVTEILYNENHIKEIVSNEPITTNTTVDQAKLSTYSDGYNYSNQSISINDYANSMSNIKSAILDNNHFDANNTQCSQPTMLESLIDQTISKNINIQQESIPLGHNYKIIGVLFDTYIVLEQGDNMLLIDQHAGHERLLYDKFKQQYMMSNINITDLMVPYIINTNYIESNFIEENLSVFDKLGFGIEPFGTNSYKVSHVPVLLKDINFMDFFDTILKDMNNIINKNDIINDYLAKSACKAAVKANDILSDNEINTLISMLNDNNTVLLCPHGRPVVICHNKKEIEKWFKRIV